MRFYTTFLMSSMLLIGVSCSSSQPTVNTVPPATATPQTNTAPAAGAVSPAAAAAVTSPAVVTNAGKIDPCALLTSKDLQAIQGEPLRETKPSARSEGGFVISQCFYSMPTFTNSVSLLVAQKGESSGARDPKEFWKETFHRVDEEQKERGNEKEKERAREKDKDKEKGARSEEEEERAVPPQKIPGVGDDAYWTGNRVGGALYALKGNTYIRISVGGPGDQAAKIKKTKSLAQIILKHF